MLRLQSKQSSFHSVLYDKIPENHILKKITTVIDFSFINDLLKDSYSERFGRPAKEPELMCKLLFLQHLYNYSDEQMKAEAELNLAFMYFLGLNPEDSLPDKSLLSKFRTQRLGENTLDEMMTEMARQCVEQGILEGKSVSIDATHIEANTKKKTPERVMKHLARNIIHTYERETGQSLENLPEVPDYQEIADHREAKAVMKDYLLNVMNLVEKQASNHNQNTKESIQKAQKILADPKFINQKGIRSLIDEDARVGRKSRTQDFYGYKTEFVMTTKERIITSVRTSNGAYTDGSYAKEMLAQTLRSNMTITEVYGDKAYFRKSILDDIKSLKAHPYIPVSSLVYRLDESQFTYNKDADEWQCSQGNITEKKKYFRTKGKDGGREGYKYYFGLKQCKACPLHDECAKKRARRLLVVGVNTAEFYEISQHQKSETFKEKYKKRASIEGKNAELKRFHGLSRTRGYGLLSASIQSKLAAVAVNIKRIAAIASSFFMYIWLKSFYYTLYLGLAIKSKKKTLVFHWSRTVLVIHF